MLTIRLDSAVSIGDQILSGIRQLIAVERIRPGDELPPVRQLAADLGVNLNTVARAYRALEQEGLVATVRGRGTQVTADREAPGRPTSATRHQIHARLRDALADAKLAGLRAQDARQLIDSVLDEYWPNSMQDLGA